MILHQQAANNFWPLPFPCYYRPTPNSGACMSACHQPRQLVPDPYRLLSCCCSPMPPVNVPLNYRADALARLCGSPASCCHDLNSSEGTADCLWEGGTAASQTETDRALGAAGLLLARSLSEGSAETPRGEGGGGSQKSDCAVMGPQSLCRGHGGPLPVYARRV